MKKILFVTSIAILFSLNLNAQAATFDFGVFASANSISEGDHFLGMGGLTASVDQGYVGLDTFIMPDLFTTRGIAIHGNIGKFSIGVGKYRSRGEFTVTTSAGYAIGNAQDTGNLAYIQYSITKHFFVRGTVTDIDYHVSGSLNYNCIPCSTAYGSRTVHASDKMLWLGYRF